MGSSISKKYSGFLKNIGFQTSYSRASTKICAQSNMNSGFGESSFDPNKYKGPTNFDEFLMNQVKREQYNILPKI